MESDKAQGKDSEHRKWGKEVARSSSEEARVLLTGVRTGAGKRAQQGKALAAKPDNQSLNP